MPLLAVDATTLKLDSEELKEEAAPTTEELFDRPGYPGEPYDMSGGRRCGARAGVCQKACCFAWEHAGA
jgi:hypothetical protein